MLNWKLSVIRRCLQVWNWFHWVNWLRGMYTECLRAFADLTACSDLGRIFHWRDLLCGLWELPSVLGNPSVNMLSGKAAIWSTDYNSSRGWFCGRHGVGSSGCRALHLLCNAVQRVQSFLRQFLHQRKFMILFLLHVFLQILRGQSQTGHTRESRPRRKSSSSGRSCPYHPHWQICPTGCEHQSGESIQIWNQPHRVHQSNFLLARVTCLLWNLRRQKDILWLGAAPDWNVRNRTRKHRLHSVQLLHA